MGKSLGEGLAHRRKDGVFWRDVEELTFLIKYLRSHNVSFHVKYVGKNFLKFPERQMTFCDLQ